MALDPAKIAAIKAAAQARIVASGATVGVMELSNSPAVVDPTPVQAETVGVGVGVTSSIKIIPTTLGPAEIIKQKISELQVALQAAAPNYETLLITIHKALQKDEDVVHLLTDEEIGVICAGLSKKKDIVIAEATVKKLKGSKTKITADDI